LRQEIACKASWDGQAIEQGIRAREIVRESARVNKHVKEGKANKLEILIWIYQL